VYLQSTGLVLDPAGNVVVSAYFCFDPLLPSRTSSAALLAHLTSDDTGAIWDVCDAAVRA
jgi:hypothetical protein